MCALIVVRLVKPTPKLPPNVGQTNVIHLGNESILVFTVFSKIGGVPVKYMATAKYISLHVESEI